MYVGRNHEPNYAVGLRGLCAQFDVELVNRAGENMNSHICKSLKMSF